jgi:nitroimidazol reductase NimA-like FMN-containing flavoprotein (pyridoxamine 5'-phosphate oxidase superfamily)
MSTNHVGTTIMSTSACLERLRSCDVGRLAVSTERHPEVFPINYVVDHGTVVFRTAEGTKLDAVAAGSDVTFEADGYDDETGDAWSVIVKGRAAEMTALADRFEALDLPLFPWHVSPKHHFVRIEPVEMSGRRFHAERPTADARAQPPAPRAAGE